jgi:hypothetical protein
MNVLTKINTPVKTNILDVPNRKSCVSPTLVCSNSKASLSPVIVAHPRPALNLASLTHIPHAQQSSFEAGTFSGNGDKLSSNANDAVFHPSAEEVKSMHMVNFKACDQHTACIPNYLDLLPSEVDIFTSLLPFISDIFYLWELVITDNLIMVMSPSSLMSQRAVLALITLISPLVYLGDFRPYYTLQAQGKEKEWKKKREKELSLKKDAEEKEEKRSEVEKMKKEEVEEDYTLVQEDDVSIASPNCYPVSMDTVSRDFLLSSSGKEEAEKKKLESPVESGEDDADRLTDNDDGNNGSNTNITNDNETASTVKH